MILFMGQVSVAEAAVRLGVGVQRIHRRIAEGSLRAERVGHQWVIDEADLILLGESRSAGRPLSERSAWAVVAVSELDRDALGRLASSERARARHRWGLLLGEAVGGVSGSEAQVHSIASRVASLLRNRAERGLYRASPRDLPDMREDRRLVLSGLSHPESGIASGEVVEAYVSADELDAVVAEYLLSEDRGGNVVVHVISLADAASGLRGPRGVPALVVAADLAEHRGPREEARAVELLRSLEARHAELLDAAGEHGQRGSHGRGAPR